MPRRPFWIVPAGLLLALSTCSGSGGAAESAADTLTRRQKDSIVSTLPVPGARVVGKALEASDAAKRRADRLDSLLSH